MTSERHPPFLAAIMDDAGDAAAVEGSARPAPVLNEAGAGVRLADAVIPPGDNGGMKITYRTRARYVLRQALKAMDAGVEIAGLGGLIGRVCLEAVPTNRSHREVWRQCRALKADVVSLCREHGIGFESEFEGWFAEATEMEARLMLGGALGAVG